MVFPPEIGMFVRKTGKSFANVWSKKFFADKRFNFRCKTRLLRLLLVIVGLARVPVLPAERPARAEPHELALLALVRAARPEVLVPQPDALDVVLQLLLVLDHGDGDGHCNDDDDDGYLGAVYAGQVHPVVAAVLR